MKIVIKNQCGILTNVLSVLVALPGSHLQLELMLGRAEMQKVLTGFTVVSLKGMLDTIRCVLQCYFLLLHDGKKKFKMVISSTLRIIFYLLVHNCIQIFLKKMH